MKIAICGDLIFAKQILPSLENFGIECRYFIRDFAINLGLGEDRLGFLNKISFWDFKRMEYKNELDGCVIATEANSLFTKEVVSIFKLNSINRVGVIDSHSKILSLYWLIPQIETQIIDGCNLNCKGCAHFSNLFKTDEIYPLEKFDHDLMRLAECADVVSFYMLGGEPFLKKDIEKYIIISRIRLPRTNLRFLTNGLLIPSLPQSLLDLLREFQVVIDISVYPQTKKILDKIKFILETNKIPYDLRFVTERFIAFMSVKGGHNPFKSRQVCLNENCRFLRDGKIYKCPPDALSFRLVEKFSLKNFPRATGIDIHSPNFSSNFKMLDGNIEMCFWCSEKVRHFNWEITKNPQLSDWLANPYEIYR